MIPLLKIRLIKLRQHIFRNLFTFFYPVLFILFFSLFRFLSNSKVPNLPNNTNSTDFNLFELPSKLMASSIAFICEGSSSNCKSFSDYLNETFKPSIYKKFDSFQETKNYVINNQTSFSYIFTLKEKNNQLDFDIRFGENSHKSVYDSMNELKVEDKNSDDITNFQIFQKAIANYYKNISSNNLEEKNIPDLNISFKTQPLKRPTIYNKYSTNAYSFLLPITISLGQSSALLYIMSWMVTEREQKIDEFTKRQGISKTTYLVSWFLTYFVLTFIPTTITCIVLQWLFFYHFLFLWIILMELLFTLNIFALAFFIQSLVDKTQTGNLLTKLIILGVTVLSIAVVRPEVSLFAKLIFCLFPQVTQVFALETLLHLDNFESGIDMHLLFTKHQGLSLGIDFIILISSCILYIIGASLVTMFKMKGNVKDISSNNILQDNEVSININHQPLLQHNIQLKQNGDVLEIKNVSRIYGDLKAVNGFSGELFKNEIFCLLGHNGAGKTTLIKMISGLEDPNGGDILLDGRSIIVNKDYLFRNLGLCAQENIFFNYLTVSEHLRYMCEIKGVRANDQEINTLLTKIALKNKMNAICDTLSGGQKRKLCIALALIGNSKLILLDEPTSGMDVVAKKELWEFLKNYKENKIIILTTHSLDEAEYLGDRIGIMTEGKFICSGSSSYLKSKYPCGFNVNFIFDSNKFKLEHRLNLIEQLRKVDNSVKIKVSSKFVFTINFANVINEVEQLFEIIDNVKESYGIINYTISTTTLEDVFLKLNDSDIEMKTTETPNTINDDSKIGLIQEVDISIPYDLNSFETNVSFCEEFHYGMKRNFITLWRGFFLFLLEIISASAIVYIYLLMFYKVLMGNNGLQDLNLLLKHRDVYILTTENITFSVKESYFYKEVLNKDVNFIPLEDYNITEKMTIEEIEEELYKNHKYKNAQSVIVIKQNTNDAKQTDIYVLYSQSAPDHYQSSMNLIMASYFEKYHQIKGTLGTSVSSVPSKDEGDWNKIFHSIGTVLAIMSIISGFQSFSSSILLNTLRERISNIKHLLYLSGSNMGAYWLTMYLIEVFKSICLLLFMSPIILYSQFELIIVYPLILCFILSLVVYCFCWSFLLRKEEQAQSSFITINLLIILVLIGITSKVSPEKILNIDKFTFTLCDLIPLSSFAYHLLRTEIFFIFFVNRNDLFTNSRIWKLVLNGCANHLIQAFIYVLLLILFEKRILEKLFNYILVAISLSRNDNYEFSISTNPHLYPKRIDEPPVQMYPQINQSPETTNQISQPLMNGQQFIPNINKFAEQEKDKVISNKGNFTVVINQLRKTFFICGCKKNLRAVNDLYLGLESNEKLGLLGFNGSGKTTTFKSITNEIFFDKGTISIFGINTKDNFEAIRKTIGYCPQENALFPQLTVEEVINFYRKIKGVNETTSEICERCGLSKYLKTKTSHLSGGNKRKLLFTIAIMSKPSLLLLDEPSTGVDPESRRIMWKNINKLSQSKDKYNMILTTHSMEEAEILCDTVSWLKQGNFVCKGNAEKLKMEFSAGYNLHIKFAYNEQLEYNDEKAINDIIPLFPYGDIKQLKENSFFGNHCYQLLEVLRILRPFCSLIEIIDIGKDLSFRLKIVTIYGKEGQLFSNILKQKIHQEYISEINIGMQSLEDIFTRFEW